MPRITSVSIIAVMTGLLLILPLQAQQPSGSEQEATSGAQPHSNAQPKAATKEEVAALEEQSAKAYEEGNFVRYYANNMKLHQVRPYEPGYMENIIAACALVNRPNTAYHYLLQMQQQGFAYDLNKNPDTESIRDTEVWEYLVNLMVNAGLPNGSGEIAFAVPAEFAHPAAITWDESRGRFLVGTEKDGAIVAVSDDGSTEVLIQANDENGLWAVRGLHADHANNRLWVSSAAIPGFSAYQAIDKGRGALFEFDLETLELKGRFNVPVDGLKHELGPMAVSGNGDIYIADLAQPMVLRKTAQGKNLETFVASKELVALRYITVSPDSGKLYIADGFMGVMVVDPVQQTSVMLTGPENLNLGAISGLFYDQGQLVMIQDGFQPDRLMRLELDASGTNVENTIPLAIALEEFDRPAFGTIKGENVYYFANPGRPGREAENKPVMVMKTPLDPGDSIKPPEQREIKRRIEARQ
jgi:hypothetical protein